MYFDAVCERDTHTYTQRDFERVREKEREREMGGGGSCLVLSVVLYFSPPDVSTSSENFHLEVTCFSNLKLLNASKWI